MIMPAAGPHADQAPYDGHTVTDLMPRSPHCATLVVDEEITKLDALDAVSDALQTPIQRAGTSSPFVTVGEEWAEVEIPKFGEAPPLAIDVYSTRSLADAQTSALALMAQLAATTGWVIRPMFTR
jgi:hypothetical protein